MINSDAFIKRLEILLDYYSLSASVFADKLGVQRSALSHLLSGRNKPSLDFIMKLNENFPEADLYWLIHGRGSFPKDADVNTPTPTPNSEIAISAADDFSLRKEEVTTEATDVAKTENFGDIDRIVIFFKDGTFKNYTGSK